MPSVEMPAASSLDDEVDLNAGPKRQGGHPDHRTGGKGLTEMLAVNAIQRHVITHVRKIHTSAHDIIETLAGRLENRREIPKDTLCLGHNAPLDHLASGRVLGDLSAEEEETIDFDCLGKWADRRREFRRGNCCFAHSNSCSYFVADQSPQTQCSITGQPTCSLSTVL